MANESDKINISFSDMTDEDKEMLLGLIRKYSDNKNNIYKPKDGEIYFCVSGCGFIHYYNWSNTAIDNNYFNMRNCFRTKEEAKFESERQKILCELANFADEHNDLDIDWNNHMKVKYFIYYDYSSKELDISYAYSSKRIGNEIFFTSKEIAESAIEHVGKDRILKYVFGI